MATKSVHRLEQALGLWEETCMSFSVLANISPEQGVVLEGPFVHWPKFRRYLLDTLNSTDFDFDRFLGNERTMSALKLSGSTIAHLPQALASWTRHSRRVFHVSEELQHLLLMTSLEGVTWEDVSWPFQSFAVTLESPIQDNHGNKYDCILVSRETNLISGEPVIGFRLFTTDFENYKPMTRDDKAKILKIIERKQWDKADRFINKRLPDKQDMMAGCFYISQEHLKLPVTAAISQVTDISEDRWLAEVFERETDHSNPHFDFGARLVVGLCLYLSSLPSGSPHVSAWKKVERKPSFDPHAVTNEAEVCSVTSVYKLTTEERAILQGGSGSARAYYEVRAHFRQGHWRRRPGTASDPDAPKVVMVRPTIVRRDRLTPGALPGGTEKVLT